MNKANQIEDHIEELLMELQINAMQETLFFTRSIEFFVMSKQEMINLMKEN